MPLQSVVALWVIAIAIIAISWSGFALSLHFKQQELQQTETTLNEIEHQLQAVKSKLDAKQNKDKFVQQLKNIEQEIAHKQQVYGYLAATQTLSSMDYSQVMIDLARYHVPNIWLTRVSFAEQKVTLQGLANQSGQLPIWLSNLKQSSYFSGKEFSVLEFADKDGVSEFNVATEVAVTKGQP
ncbi:PilN domain-containing protein [Pseudoalteromonas shioyasakiensis]|uniref:PilN domain-containing protein n=1 Tax=Pseudoalteromonas shioyasakiensis TaxID=1190813 RepID=UPI002117D408|nr:PilN domain-containing protein [Pseudoalteromonas shioyasakiensis]MCQ8879165.1 PilN domain-containing protein [Pseudoalteromonas shioyasakiensis]